MISPNMLPQTCKIYRNVNDESKSYVTSDEQLIGEYACYISTPKSIRQMQSSPENIVSADLEVLMNLPADIKPGDRLECDGESYSVGFVHKPANRHIQAYIRCNGEA